MSLHKLSAGGAETEKKALAKTTAVLLFLYFFLTVIFIYGYDMFLNMFYMYYNTNSTVS